MTTHPILAADFAHYKGRAEMPKKTRQIEYYRLWPGGSGDSGTWDTDFVDIPADTPDNHIGEAVERAVAAIRWRDEPPIITGIYSMPEPEEEEEEDHG